VIKQIRMQKKHRMIAQLKLQAICKGCKGRRKKSE